MASNTGYDSLSKFMDMGQKVVQKANGINAQSLHQLASLASRLQLSAQEMEAAGAQLGLNNIEVKQIVRDGHLISESGGGSALRWVMVLGCLAILLGVGGGVAFFLLNQKDGQQTAQTTPNTSPTNPEKTDKVTPTKTDDGK